MEDSVHHPVSIPLGEAIPHDCESCISRRDFIAKSTLAAAALAALEGCGDGQIGAPVTLTDGPFTIRVSDFPGLATTGTLVDVGAQAQYRAVIRTSANAFSAFSRICTHQQCLTAVQNNRFECPCHGSVFSNTGAVINGPAASPLLKLNVTVNGDGTLTIA
jgi:Rieske Fe-S protein